MEPENTFSTGDDGKTAGIISYLTIIGWLIAFFAMHSNNKTSLGSYQLRQTLLFHLVAMLASWILGILFAAVFFSSGVDAGFFSLVTFNWIVRLIFFILWLVGFIGAVNGEKRPIPLIGERAQSIFSSI